MSVTRARASIAISAIALLILAGCKNNADLFEDFRGVNLIAGVDFSNAGWVAEQGATYMDFSPAGVNFTDGSPAYRLEIKNLFPNGDFDATNIGASPAGWSEMGTGAPAVTVGSEVISAAVSESRMRRLAIAK